MEVEGWIPGDLAGTTSHPRDATPRALAAIASPEGRAERCQEDSDRRGRASHDDAVRGRPGVLQTHSHGTWLEPRVRQCHGSFPDRPRVR